MSLPFDFNFLAERAPAEELGLLAVFKGGDFDGGPMFVVSKGGILLWEELKEFGL
jgi:hypothetical protein